MHLREATPLDYHDMGAIQAVCNTRDTIARHFIKDMDKYPTTYHRSSLRLVKRRAAVPGSILFVVETDPSDYSTKTRYKSPEVIGFAAWTRIGESPVAQEWKTRNSSGLWAGVNRLLDSVEDRYVRTFTGVNQTFRTDKLLEISPLLDTPFDEKIFAEAWDLQLCFVHPEWQRKGVGRMLIQWGCDQATREKVPVVVKSSALGAMAYRACGFQSLGVVDLKRFFDTTEFGGEEPQMWCWEPAGQKGFWYEKGKEALEKAMKEERGKGWDT